jgi:hypothetical protein
MSRLAVLDEKSGQELKIRKIARETMEADPAVSFAALLGRPFPGIELFDRVADTVFFIKDQEARYVAVNDTLAHRCRFASKSALIGRKASEVFAARSASGSRRRISKSSLKASRSVAEWNAISIPTAAKAGA